MAARDQYLIPKPVLFNCMKHHAGFIANFIESEVSANAPSGETGTGDDIVALREALLKLGRSQMDLYTGNLAPSVVAEEIIRELVNRQLLNTTSYNEWLRRSTGRYQTLTLSDGSSWILLKGKTDDRFIHIHPGRFSRFTTRVRAETLRTAIAVLWYCKNNGYRQIPDLHLINDARRSILDLSPVKELRQGKGLSRMIEILREKLSA